ncbi:hypothetical protein [Nonomuraea rosea]
MSLKRSVQIRTTTGHVADGGGWDPNVKGSGWTHEVELDHAADAINAAIDVLHRYGCTEWVCDPDWPYHAEPSTRPHNNYLEERAARLHGFSSDEETRIRARLSR